MSDNTSIEDRILTLLENIVLQGFNIKNDSTWEDMGIDSAEKIDFLMDLEEEFRLDIPDEVMEYLETVEEVIEYIRRMAK